MVSILLIKITRRAIAHRMVAEQRSLEDVMAEYTKLTDTQKGKIRELLPVGYEDITSEHFN